MYIYFYWNKNKKKVLYFKREHIQSVRHFLKKKFLFLILHMNLINLIILQREFNDRNNQLHHIILAYIM